LEQYAGSLFRDVVHPLFHEIVVHPKIRNVPTNQDKVDEVPAKAVPETAYCPLTMWSCAPNRCAGSFR